MLHPPNSAGDIVQLMRSSAKSVSRSPLGLLVPELQRFFPDPDGQPNDEVKDRLARFKHDLRTSAVLDVVQKHLTVGRAYVLTQDEEFELRKRVSQHFGMNPDGVKVVGSSQLGFSIAPTKRYRPFHDASDIDIAVISPEAFDRIWLQAHEYVEENGPWRQIEDFRKYLMMGWIRPDKLPREQSFAVASEWVSAMGEIGRLTKNGAFKIAAGLYRTHTFLESYQLRSTKLCQEELELES